MKRTIALLATLAAVFAWPGAAGAATGDLVGTVTFANDCSSSIGVGIAFDGANLWYSCYYAPGSNDLYRADPITGAVTASYSLAGGLGALSYDATRNVIWAGYGGGSAPSDTVYQITLDGSQNATGIAPAFQTGDFCGLDDGLAFDARGPGALDDVIYYSDDCFTTTLVAYDLTGVAVESFPWTGTGCYNSGLAIGGQLLFQGSDGCNHVWVIDKTTKAAAFDFATTVPGDVNFRDEDLECDTHTFAPIQVMWSKEAYSPMRAAAFEIPTGTCGTGGVSEENHGAMTGGGSAFTSSGVRVTHGFELYCSPTDGTSNLEVNWGKGKRFHLTSLDSASCTDDPAIAPEPPTADFDTYTGSGTGTYSGVPGATAEWTFTDAGEPGTSDSVKLTIKDASNVVVLSVTGTLNSGNHQAHAA